MMSLMHVQVLKEHKDVLSLHGLEKLMGYYHNEMDTEVRPVKHTRCWVLIPVRGMPGKP